MEEKNCARKHLALISLGLGFLLIWTTVISSVLLSNTFEENVNTANVQRLLNAHQDVGRIIFALGHEMVSTVDWLLVDSESQKPTKRDFDSISITWKMSDSVIDTVKDRSRDRWIEGEDFILDIISQKLNLFRSNSLSDIMNPIDVMHFYLDLCTTIKVKWETKGFKGDPFFLPVSYLAFNRFNDGMAKRFAEISLGTIYVRSSIPLNNSEYFQLHYTSRESLEAAFSFNRRGQQRYWELLLQDPQATRVLPLIGEDILAGSLNRGTSRLSAAYIETVKEEIATLLLAKDILNASLSAELKRLTMKKHTALLFHLSLAIIAFLAVAMCLSLICFVYRYIGNVEPVKAEETTTASKESIYSLTIDDKTIFLAPNLYHKPNCNL